MNLADISLYDTFTTYFEDLGANEIAALESVFPPHLDFIFPDLSDEQFVKKYLSDLLKVDIEELDGYVDGLALVESGYQYDSATCTACDTVGYNVGLQLICHKCYGKGIIFSAKQ